MERMGELGVHHWAFVHLADALLNPSRSHIKSRVVVVLPEDPRVLCFEMGINNRQKVVCFLKGLVFFFLMVLFF